jgi:hypothetical protein
MWNDKVTIDGLKNYILPLRLTAIVAGSGKK